jgi:hypothetical protein
VIKAAEIGDLTHFEAESRVVVEASAEVSKAQRTNDGPPSICPHPGSHNRGTPAV